LTERSLNEGEGGALLFCINAVQQPWIDKLHNFPQEGTHARIAVKVFPPQPQFPADCRQRLNR
jgi:hypothetical protein